LFTVTIKYNWSTNEKDRLSRAIHAAASLLDAPVLREQQGFRQLSRRLRASALLNENSSA
jgi:hypothetical protein